MEIFNYLVRVSIIMALGYLPYRLIFKKLTFFSINRFYLLFIVAASLILPVLHIRVIEHLPVNNIDQNVKLSSNGNFEMEKIVLGAEPTDFFNWQFMVCLIYGLVCMIILIKLLYNIFKVVRQAIVNGVSMGNYCIVEVDHTNNSSFFNIIFLHRKMEDGLELEQVLTHEKAHSSLLHSVDILFIELVKVLLWVNPLIYFIGNDLKEMHEYEVDDHVKRIFNPKDYASLLIKLLNQPSTNIFNQFSAYCLKSRVKMLFKPQSQAYKKCFYLLIFPFLVLMGYFFSIQRVYGRTPKKNNFVLVLDAGHGGTNFGAVGIDGRHEKDVNLQIVKSIKAVAEERGIKVILTRSDDRFLDVEHRVDNQGDAFLSIHMNSAIKGALKTNGTEIIINKNSLYPFSEKLAVNTRNTLQKLRGINPGHKIDIIGTSGEHSVYVLNHNKAPAILIELGFMTDNKDINYILSPGGQHDIAEEIIDAVINYTYAK